MQMLIGSAVLLALLAPLVNPLILGLWPGWD
jgi:hypothetical protein